MVDLEPQDLWLLVEVGVGEEQRAGAQQHVPRWRARSGGENVGTTTVVLQMVGDGVGDEDDGDIDYTTQTEATMHQCVQQR